MIHFLGAVCLFLFMLYLIRGLFGHGAMKLVMSLCAVVAFAAFCLVVGVVVTHLN